MKAIASVCQLQITQDHNHLASFNGPNFFLGFQGYSKKKQTLHCEQNIGKKHYNI